MGAVTRYFQLSKAIRTRIISRSNNPLQIACYALVLDRTSQRGLTVLDPATHKSPCCRNSVRLAIRKIMYAPSKQGEQPSVEVSKEFVMSPNKLHLEASLDKELYHHGENIAVNVHIANNSNRTVKKIKVSVRQFADICLFSTAQYKCTVAEAESE